MREYYLCRHIRNDLNVPFYIGSAVKAQNSNEYTRAFQRSTRTPQWKNIYETTHRDIEVEIIYETSSKDEILKKEIEFIKLYGRLDLNQGTLVNMTDGGKGAKGLIISEQHSKKLSVANKGKIVSLEAREKMRQAKLGKKLSQEHIEKMRKARIGHLTSQETKDKISKALIGHKFSSDTIKKIINTLKAKDHLRPRDSKGHYKKMK